MSRAGRIHGSVGIQERQGDSTQPVAQAPVMLRPTAQAQGKAVHQIAVEVGPEEAHPSGRLQHILADEHLPDAERVSVGTHPPNRDMIRLAAAQWDAALHITGVPLSTEKARNPHIIGGFRGPQSLPMVRTQP